MACVSSQWHGGAEHRCSGEHHGKRQPMERAQASVNKGVTCLGTPIQSSRPNECQGNVLGLQAAATVVLTHTPGFRLSICWGQTFCGNILRQLQHNHCHRSIHLPQSQTAICVLDPMTLPCYDYSPIYRNRPCTAMVLIRGHPGPHCGLVPNSAPPSVAQSDAAEHSEQCT